MEQAGRWSRTAQGAAAPGAGKSRCSHPGAAAARGTSPGRAGPRGVTGRAGRGAGRVRQTAHGHRAESVLGLMPSDCAAGLRKRNAEQQNIIWGQSKISCSAPS